MKNYWERVYFKLRFSPVTSINLWAAIKKIWKKYLNQKKAISQPLIFRSLHVLQPISCKYLAN